MMNQTIRDKIKIVKQNGTQITFNEMKQGHNTKRGIKSDGSFATSIFSVFRYFCFNLISLIRFQ